ncbi:hypothetical protein TorRG33x02_264340 [Trema orientale]|uniref:Uncharacterized protein n=1 Tax=Trema orientale TaxID=63057 RepID=A0A2P5D2K4_TREOI|nr:hypothetical protein TorRG33x02_264340 [Trema orientale]
MRNFLRRGSDGDKLDHLVAWEEVCQSKSKGSLEIGNLVRRNKALLTKWLWRFALEKNELWHKVIRSKYGISPNNWDSRMTQRTTCRSPWNFISNQYHEFLNLVGFKVRNSNSLRFLEDA